MKKREQQRHAIRRAYERYGIRISENDLEQIAGWIQARTDPRVQLLRRQSNRTRAYMVMFREKHVDVLYDTNTHSIVTFLTPESES